MIGVAEVRKSLEHGRLRNCSGSANRPENPLWPHNWLQTEKTLISPLRHGIMAKTEYPGVAQLVAHVIWVHGAERSNRSTRTKSPLKSVDFRGLFFAYCDANFEVTIDILLLNWVFVGISSVPFCCLCAEKRHNFEHISIAKAGAHSSAYPLVALPLFFVC